MHWKVTAGNIFQPNKFRILAAINKTRATQAASVHNRQLKETLFCEPLTFLQSCAHDMMWQFGKVMLFMCSVFVDGSLCSSGSETHLPSTTFVSTLSVLKAKTDFFPTHNQSVYKGLIISSRKPMLWQYRPTEPLNWTSCSSLPVVTQEKRASTVEGYVCPKMKIQSLSTDVWWSFIVHKTFLELHSILLSNLSRWRLQL